MVAWAEDNLARRRLIRSTSTSTTRPGAACWHAVATRRPVPGQFRRLRIDARGWIRRRSRRGGRAAGGELKATSCGVPVPATRASASAWPRPAQRRVRPQLPHGGGIPLLRGRVALVSPRPEPGGGGAGRVVRRSRGVTYDEANRRGIFEPVVTHPDHRRRGLARALMLEGMRRARALGRHGHVRRNGRRRPGQRALRGGRVHGGVYGLDVAQGLVNRAGCFVRARSPRPIPMRHSSAPTPPLTRTPILPLPRPRFRFFCNLWYDWFS